MGIISGSNRSYKNAGKYLPPISPPPHSRAFDIWSRGSIVVPICIRGATRLICAQQYRGEFQDVLHTFKPSPSCNVFLLSTTCNCCIYSIVSADWWLFVQLSNRIDALVKEPEGTTPLGRAGFPQSVCSLPAGCYPTCSVVSSANLEESRIHLLTNHNIYFACAQLKILLWDEKPGLLQQD